MAKRSKRKPVGQQWRTFSLQVPKDVYDLILASRQKIAELLEVDLKDEKRSHTNWILVEEAIVALILTTDESILKQEVLGDD